MLQITVQIAGQFALHVLSVRNPYFNRKRISVYESSAQSKRFWNNASGLQEQGATITQQRKDFEAAIAQQQKQIEALTAAVKEQAAQMQKVSAQLEASKSAPQVVNNP